MKERSHAESEGAGDTENYFWHLLRLRAKPCSYDGHETCDCWACYKAKRGGSADVAEGARSWRSRLQDISRSRLRNW
jgi:hypothetical protein